MNPNYLLDILPLAQKSASLLFFFLRLLVHEQSFLTLVCDKFLVYKTVGYSSAIPCLMQLAAHAYPALGEWDIED